ncbi:hypothetical protein QUB80_07450 [Chlorogloeopsis sp. ULAP01]|uniref:hypothetical protein n=1 Tax=Chlorogloeopsis sp. ULAP01 TaxID=3056483 RepID=UPI0025AB2973|nr:hypothetical protein [Chlorogloeopsis sp. ULAP01]MDM9380539.1 hypothetical protein [Chlorogloeopsis sp. ULAP01]
MDSEKRRRYQTAMVSTYYPDRSFLDYIVMPDGAERSYGSDILKKLLSGKVFVINSRKRNGLILFKQYHAEFAGPGAAVGGDYDRDCQGALPIGNLSLLPPETNEERQKAYLIRRQWIRLIKQITENQVPQQRVQKILDQFEQYFPPEVVALLPDEAFALLVGVLPQTVAVVRRLGSEVDNRFYY